MKKENKNNKKNKIGLFIFIGVVVAAVGLMIYASAVLNEKHSNEDKYLVELSYKELNKKIKNKDSFILVVTRTDCSHCASFKPKFKDILAKYEITAYEVAVDKFSDEEKSDFKEIANVTGTPTTIFIEDGEEATTTNRLIGDVNTTKIVNRLKALGYIK